MKTAPHDLEAIVGSDLWTLLREHDFDVVSATRVSRASTIDLPPVAFRLQLADGSSIKGRRFVSEAAAGRACDYGRLLPAGPFPRVVARCGTAVATEWVEGDTLTADAVTEDITRSLGVILRAVHAVRVPEKHAGSGSRYPGSNWRGGLTSRLARLQAVGLVSEHEALKVVALTDTHVPASCAGCLVHGDFARANVVADDGGGLHLIDNESCEIHAPAFDLARISYRWPMTVPDRRAFYEGYGRADVVADYEAHAVYWAIIVALGSAEFRVRTGLPGVGAPLAYLRRVLQGS